MVDLVSASAGSTATGSTNSLSALSEDYTRFLTLLTAQIENQDPLAPMDSTQFVSQLAQLSQVEQSVKTNSNLETLSAQFSALTATTGAQMIGREVTVYSETLVLSDGASDGYYLVGDGATEVTAEIYDPLTERVVRTLTGLSTEAGELQAIDWDGLDDSGEKVLDGTYSVTLTAVGSEGEDVSVYPYRRTTVNEALFSDGELYYRLLGGGTVASGDVMAVRSSTGAPSCCGARSGSAAR
ncbi:flagellar hook assembly protein FlgD [Pseudodonghicola flavimaris]|uniref:Basal-body rod modification protein FlgD n=1 Tax=Pseudodonghicola flavimaris TaxID=3050036 RepID=A0ABT7EWK8_9RHOB|nr:flagellar hook assembly protein FlgD [Pseudodonghicola flavimaris]MDK3016729.1 flagellar hook assembly protein FlgD [Pseudodonghicola flavimaris]